jgi:hypothetical protein
MTITNNHEPSMYTSMKTEGEGVENCGCDIKSVADHVLSEVVALLP